MSQATIAIPPSVTEEARYYILSVLLPAQRFAEAVRDHVSFREDACRVRTDHAPGEPPCDPAVRLGAAEA